MVEMCVIKMNGFQGRKVAIGQLQHDGACVQPAWLSVQGTQSAHACMLNSECLDCQSSIALRKCIILCNL